MTWFGIDTAVYSCRCLAMGCGACSTGWAGQMQARGFEGVIACWAALLDVEALEKRTG